MIVWLNTGLHQAVSQWHCEHGTCEGHGVLDKATQGLFSSHCENRHTAHRGMPILAMTGEQFLRRKGYH